MCLNVFLTARNSSYGKVMFSQMCVIPSVHRGVCIQSGLHPAGSASMGICSGGWAHPPQIGYYRIRSTSGRHASYWNAFLVILITSNSL